MVIESDEWIDWYFTPYLDSIKRDRRNNIPFTKEHIAMCAARLPYKKYEGKGGKKWSDKVYKASINVLQELYKYALDTESLMSPSVSFDEFLEWIYSDSFKKEVGFFGNHFG